MTNALIIDHSSGPCGDEHCVSLEELLGRQGLHTRLIESTDSAAAASIAFRPDIVFVRVTADAAGEQWLLHSKERWGPALIVLILCSSPGLNTAALGALIGFADDFLYCSASKYELALRGARLLSRMRQKTDDQSRETEQFLGNLPFVGRSPVFLRAIHKAANVARADGAVLISGETGSGKELVARAIHYHGARRSKPFIPVNCGALPDHLFENELFGHVKGAFTDASSAEKGLIAEAEDGTLFLDEVDALSPAAQVKLLRFLQNGEYRPLGSSRSVIADVRVIAASNCDLRAKVDSKQFREDLFYRLNILSVALPALRERGEHVLKLADHFIDLYGNRAGACPCLSEAARRKLLDYSWPGNVRELEGVIRRAALLSTGGILHAADIELPEGKSKDLLRNESLRRAKSFMIGEFERTYVANLLAQHQGNITRAAKAAGKDRRTLQRLVRKYSLNRVSFKD